MLVFKKGKVIKSQGIKLDDGEVIKEIRAESYIFELVKLKKNTHTRHERNLPKRILKKSLPYFTIETKWLQQNQYLGCIPDEV